MRTPLVAGNWKMNGDFAMLERWCAAARSHGQLAQRVARHDVEILICPAYPYLPAAVAALAGTGVQVGAQNVADKESGALTGEVSAQMLLELGCRYAIVGHSERRHLYAESNELVSARFHQALNAGLRPILCVGETQAERDNHETLTIIGQQLAAVLDLMDNNAALVDMVIAYEPVWAIGTGQTATPEQAQEVHRAIRQWLMAKDTAVAEKVRVIYGGSVKPDNAKALMSMPDIDGALVGGASLDANSFIEIVNLCNH